MADLNFEIIVGGANNQLATSDVAGMLAAAGTLYIPDFLANAGGIINIAQEPNGYDPACAMRQSVESARRPPPYSGGPRRAGYHSGGCSRGVGRRATP